MRRILAFTDGAEASLWQLQRRPIMNRVLFTLATITLAASAATAGAGPAPEATEIHAQGCVQPGVENRCLVLKDIRSGKLYNIMVKEPLPAIGSGINFTGTPYDGVTACMQGAPVTVTKWERNNSLKCTQTEAPKP
jgi:hypothetical protein